MTKRKTQASAAGDRQRLRKQPRMRRIQSASSIPMSDLSMPKTAQKRKRRNSQQRIRRPLSNAKGIVFNARWLSLAILGLCCYALYLIGTDERFYLNYIPVEGVSSLEINEVAAASGLPGRHIFAADPQEAADRIGEVGGVITATVTLHWPNDVLIRVSEKPPLATWQEGESEYWVDEDGQLSEARAQTVGLLNIISEIPDSGSSTSPEEDQQAASEEKIQADATAEETADAENTVDAQVAFVPQPVLQGALQLRALRPNIEKLYYAPSGGLSYQDGRGWRAYFGSGLDMQQKLVVYETVVAKLMERGVRPEYISVSNQYKPYYRLAP